MTRRDLLQQAGLAASGLAGTPADPANSSHPWLRSVRILIAEGYNAPFYPALVYEPDRALGDRSNGPRARAGWNLLSRACGSTKS
jgi:hypothetical protein